MLIILVACSGDPVKSGTQWKGVCTQANHEPYPMVLTITERKGGQINGILHWPTLRDSKTKFTGKVAENNVSFTEYELIQGSNIGLPTVYNGEVVGNSIVGNWHGQYSGGMGTFEINLAD